MGELQKGIAGYAAKQACKRYLALVSLWLGLMGCASAAGDTLTLSQAQLGNIFSSSETVRIPVQTTADSIAWTATDFFGGAVSGGPIAVNSQGFVTITPQLNRLGYFALHVTALRSGASVETADTSFAVVAPVTVASMGDSPFGVCTHFAQGLSTDLMPLIARGGIAQFRDEQYWESVEPTLTAPPSYVFPDYFQTYMATAATLGLNPCTECDFANPNYDGGHTPYTSSGVSGYANYCVALLNHYGSQIQSVNIWNEYNGSYCDGPATADRPAYYTAMLKAAYMAIKANHPTVQVAGGACVPLPIPWFQDLFADGALDYMDVADIHPYTAIPEGIENDLGTLQTLMAQYNHGNGTKPMWATECGYTDDVNPGRQIMASYLVRLMTLMRTAGVERAFWYLMCDDASNSSGLLRGPADAMGPFVPSSGYPAYANLIQQLYGAAAVRREASDSRTRIYLFHRATDNADVRVTWSTSGVAQLILSASAPLTVINIMGESTVLQPVNGLIALTADINAVYVVGQVTGIREVGRDALLADSVQDFSSVQGTSPGSWVYGYYDGDITAYGSNYLSSSFKQMTYTRASAEYTWSGPYYALQIDKVGAHPSNRAVDPNNPGGDYTQVWAVRRWQSNASGNARIVGSVARSSPYGDGSGAMVYVDGVQVYSTIVTGSGGASFDLTVPIRYGSAVDFVTTCGPSSDVNYDYAAYPVQISGAVPAPTTFSAWQGQNFTAAEIVNTAISGDAASPAGDGVPNLLKYAENLKPKVPVATASTAAVATVNSSKYQTLTYRQSQAASDLTFATEINSGNLAASSAWAAGGQLLGTPVLNGDGSLTVTVRDDTPLGLTHPRAFMRLRVTRQ